MEIGAHGQTLDPAKQSKHEPEAATIPRRLWVENLALAWPMKKKNVL